MAEENVEKENARIGYDVATNLWIYEGQLIWNEFNTMVLANSILFAFIGLIRIDELPQSPNLSTYIDKTIVMLFPFLGLMLCYFWYKLTDRGFEIYYNRVKSAREIEYLYLKPIITISRAGDFADGKEVTLELGGASPERVQLSNSSWKSRSMAIRIIKIFMIAYILLELRFSVSFFL